MVTLLASLAFADPTVQPSDIVAPIEALGGGHYLDAAGHELTREDLIRLLKQTPRGRAYLRQYGSFGKATTGLLVGGGIGLAGGIGMMAAGCSDFTAVCGVGILGVTLAPGALVVGGVLGSVRPGLMLQGANQAALELHGIKTPGGPAPLFNTTMTTTKTINGQTVSKSWNNLDTFDTDAVVGSAAAVPPPPRPPALPSVDERLVTGQKATRDAAVVIGLEDYAFIPDVPYAKRDAAAFYDFLLYTRGIPSDRIQLVTAAGKEGLEAAVSRAGQQAGAGGAVWVYFAGHGAANPSNGERMLLGDDVRSDATGFAARGVKVSDVEKLASSTGARPVLVLDTCYSGLGRNGETLIAKTRFAVPQYDARSAIVDGVEWNAAGPDQLSGPLEAVQHGAFTYFVLGALRGWADGELDGKRDGNVSGREADAYVRRALRSAQKLDQQPVWIGPTDPILARGVTETGPPI
jgi:hypothetical protein